MSSILDQVVTVGVESTYGTPETSTVRSYEAKADTFTRDVEYIDSIGFRRDQQTLRSDRSDTISLGATGSLEMDVMDKGSILEIAPKEYKEVFGGPCDGWQSAGPLPILNAVAPSSDTRYYEGVLG